jgi:hypothetical protein
VANFWECNNIIDTSSSHVLSAFSQVKCDSRESFILSELSPGYHHSLSYKCFLMININYNDTMSSPFSQHRETNIYTEQSPTQYSPLHYLLKLCNSSPPSRFFIGTPFCPNPNLLKIVFREILSSSSNLTSSNGASATAVSSTFGIFDTRNLLPVRDEMDPARVLILESRLNRGELGNVGDAAMVGDVPPMSNDLLYPCD